IFLPGAGIVKGAAIAPFTRSQEPVHKRSNEHKVNGTMPQIHHPGQWMLIDSLPDGGAYALSGLQTHPFISGTNHFNRQATA
ncbi:hypothetical protein OA791_18855, partial [Citrobacter portucalensis]